MNRFKARSARAFFVIEDHAKVLADDRHLFWSMILRVMIAEPIGSEELRALAGLWLDKGDTALLAFSKGLPCDAEKLVSEARAAIKSCASKPEDSADAAQLGLIEAIGLRALRVGRVQTRIRCTVMAGVDAHVPRSELEKWFAASVQSAYGDDKFRPATRMLTIVPEGLSRAGIGGTHDNVVQLFKAAQGGS